MNVRLSAALYALAALSCLADAAAQPASDPPALLEISTSPERPVPGEPLRIDVQGDWTKGCRPQLAAVDVRRSEIVLRTDRADANCDRGDTLQLSTRTLDTPLLAPPAAGVYRVRVETTPQAGADARVLAFRLLEIGDAKAAAPLPESGYWWGEAGGEFDVAKPGFGTQLEVQGGTLVMTFSHYTDAGAPEWSLASGALNGRISELQINRLVGGRGPFAPFSAPARSEDVGRVLIEWLTPGRAVFWFVRRQIDESLLVQPVSMVRFAFASAQQGGWHGRWVLLPAAGSGAARAIDFATYQAGDGGFELQAPDGEHMLCRTVLTRPNSPPRECTLKLSGDAAPIVFDQVGLDRLHGVDADGKRVLLLRAE